MAKLCPFNFRGLPRSNTEWEPPYRSPVPPDEVRLPIGEPESYDRKQINGLIQVGWVGMLDYDYRSDPIRRGRSWLRIRFRSRHGTDQFREWFEIHQERHQAVTGSLPCLCPRRGDWHDLPMSRSHLVLRDYTLVVWKAEKGNRHYPPGRWECATLNHESGYVSLGSDRKTRRDARQEAMEMVPRSFRAV